MSGNHIELFLVDGTPGGLTTAEILNWTGQVLSAPRSGMSALVRRPELTDGSIVIEGKVGKVVKDIVFGSPSTAGAIAQGRSCKGRISWIARDGSTFGAWESRGVD